MISEAEIEQVRRLADDMSNRDHGLSALETVAEVIAYAIAVARDEGRDEVHDIELLLRASDDTDIVRAELDELEASNAPDWRIASCRRKLDASITYRENSLREAERIMRSLRYTRVADMIRNLITERAKSA